MANAATASALPAQAPKKKRDPSFDIAKGLAIYLVALGHLTTADALNIPIDFTHMPVFFFISGWFFARYFRSGDGGEAKRFRQKAARLLLPFLLWSLVAWAFNVVLHLRSGDGLLVSALWEAIDIFFHARSLWFLLIMFLLFAYMLLCHWVGRKTPVSQYAVAIAGWLVLYVFFPDSDTVSVLRVFKFEWLFPLFMCGCFLGGGTRAAESLRGFYRRFKPLCLVVLIAAFIAVFFLYDQGVFHAYSVPNVWAWEAPWYPAAIVGYYVLSMACVTLVLLLSGLLARTPLAGALQTAGLYSLDVYVIHMFFISALKIVLPEGLRSGALFDFGIAPLSALVITVVVVLLAKHVLDRIPPYRRLMGRAGN